MNLSDVAKLRLENQQLAGSKLKTVQGIVGWMGAMQAQDFNMAKWAIGVRLPGSTERTVRESLDKGEILRTHLLRPTWHFVSADDIHWLLELTAPHIKASLRSRHNALGLTREICAESNGIIRGELSGGKFLSRNEMIAALKQAKMGLNDPQAYYHLLLNAELDGVICSGAIKEKEPTYALLAGRAPKKKALNRNEALAELAKRYFTSHGPATVQDFAWWSGLPVTNAKKALEMAHPDLASETIGPQLYWLAKSFSPHDGIDKDDVVLLPAFDEFILSYKDRSAAIPRDLQKKAISANGIFRPVILLNGQAIGIWKRTIKKNEAIIGARFFRAADKKIRGLLAKEAAHYGRFLGNLQGHVETGNVKGPLAIDIGLPKR
jgi:hypothetical protein